MCVPMVNADVIAERRGRTWAVGEEHARLDPRVLLVAPLELLQARPPHALHNTGSRLANSANFAHAVNMRPEQLLQAKGARSASKSSSTDLRQ